METSPDIGGGDAPGDTTTDVPTVDAGYEAIVDAYSGDAPPLSNGVATMAGSAASGYVDGVQTNARFDNPVNVLVGPQGYIYIADFDNWLVRKMKPNGVVMTLTPPSSSFVRPFGMVFSGTTFWVHTDFESSGSSKEGALWKIDPITGKRTVELDRIGFSRGVAALSDGRLVLSNFVDHVVNIYDPKAKKLTLLAGQANKPAYTNGTGKDAQFDSPYDVVVTPSDEIILADRGNHRLRKLTLAGAVSLFAGDGNAKSTDGSLLAASFNQPQGLAIDSAGTIYVSEVGGFVIRAIENGQVKTIAGDGTAGYKDDPNPLLARFNGLEGIDVTPDGKILYVADGNRGLGTAFHRVRRVLLP
jgi:DNA-binding beta-propeller fold protein YncE